ncbi:hypothetical protein L7750_19450 [Xenorhabdus bovienii]|uniref:hypothetical protein n=1 Tax=Xenorhabdus bovienii TaxID=40576 RepID=UPI001EDCD9F1|nr:hypothetical protein [Xenorhabdus bovienii]MCG3472462.1 hypothetical protein [Xenorhabdus bovienii]
MTHFCCIARCHCPFCRLTAWRHPWVVLFWVSLPGYLLVGLLFYRQREQISEIKLRMWELIGDYKSR